MRAVVCLTSSLLLLIAAPARAADPVADAELLSSFKVICVDAFGDATKVAAAATGAGLMKEVAGPGPDMGTAWHSSKLSIGYSDAAWLPKDLPSPQCSLKAVGLAAHDHAALAARLGALLGLPAGKTKGKAGRFETQWDFAGTGKDRRRLFLTTAPSPEGPAIRISLLNLRR